MNQKEDWKYFGKFYLIQIIVLTVMYWVFKDANPQTDEMLYANIIDILVPPILYGFMIYNYKAIKPMSNLQKLVPLIGLLITNFIGTFMLNYFNFFDRIITQKDMLNGVHAKTLNLILAFILCLPIIKLVKIKTKNVC